jgi:hypothetical protein
MIALTQKYKYSVMLFVLFAFITCCAGVVLAADSDLVEVNVGLNTTDKTQLANKLKDIFQGIGYFIGIIAVGVLIFNGFRLATATNEQKRAEVKTHIIWTLGAVVLVALAMMIVGYVISLVGGDAATGIILIPFML